MDLSMFINNESCQNKDEKIFVWKNIDPDPLCKNRSNTYDIDNDEVQMQENLTWYSNFEFIFEFSIAELLKGS